jgi:hypothetical protein
MKSVQNLISYLHEFFQNFSQSLAICFELLSFGEFVYSKIADSGPHLSCAACRAGPVRQRVVAASLPRAAHLARALRRCRDTAPRVPTTRLAPARQCPAFRATVVARQRPTPPRAHRRRPDRLARAAVVSTASSPTAPSS